MTKSKDGLTAWEAIRLFSPEPEIAQTDMIKSDLEPWEGGPTWVDAEYDERLGEALRPVPGVLVLVNRLADGTWHAMGLRKPFEPNDPSEYIPAHLWDILDLDPDANTAFGGGLEYFRLRFYKGKYERRLTAAPSPRTTDPLAGAAEPPDKRPRNRNVETEALFKNHIKTVIAKAKAKWPYPESRPGINQMARLLVAGQPKSKVEGFGQEAIRKILAGTYKPAKDRGIPGLSSG